MAAIDWILLLVLVASFVIGLWRGLVFEVLSLVGWVLAFICARWFGPAVAAWLPIGDPGDTLRAAAGYLIVFVATAFGFGLLASLVRKLIASAGLRPVDRTLGAVFGLARGLLLLLAGTWIIESTALHDSRWWTESAGAPVLRAALDGLKPVMPTSFGNKFLT